jgi:hypothetical protein
MYEECLFFIQLVFLFETRLEFAFSNVRRHDSTLMCNKTDRESSRPMTSRNVPQRDLNREGKGWLAMILIMFMFPALFYLCVFFPIWVGMTSQRLLL